MDLIQVFGLSNQSPHNLAALKQNIAGAILGADPNMRIATSRIHFLATVDTKGKERVIQCVFETNSPIKEAVVAAIYAALENYVDGHLGGPQLCPVEVAVRSFESVRHSVHSG